MLKHDPCCYHCFLMQAVELGRKLGQGSGSRRVSHAGAEGRIPRRQSSLLEGPRRQSSGSGHRLGLRRQGSSSANFNRLAPAQLEQLLTGSCFLPPQSTTWCCITSSFAAAGCGKSVTAQTCTICVSKGQHSSSGFCSCHCFTASLAVQATIHIRLA